MNFYCTRIIPLLLSFLITVCSYHLSFATLLNDSPLWSHLQSGFFVPNSYFTLKSRVVDPRFWKDDASIWRFVSVGHAFTTPSYTPAPMVSLSGANISQAWRNTNIRADVKPSLLDMARDFSSEFHEPLIIISGYRSSEYQQWMWDLGKCIGWAFCAKPGESEHQTGLAADFFDATNEKEYLSNPRYKSFVIWMQANAYKYGWTQSYQNWPKFEWYEIEPWHWRYVGIDMAKFLHMSHMSLTQYLYMHNVLSQII